MEFAGIFTVLILIVGIIIYTIHALEKKRTQEMHSIAIKKGYDFYETDPGYSSLITSADYQLMRLGHSKKIRNILTSKKEIETVSENIVGMEVIFDYSYTTQGGKNSQTHTQTVISYKSEDLAIPSFYLHEEGLGSKILAKFTNVKDINFEKYPKFSNKYILYGSDEEKIREFFDDSLLRFFENFQDTIRVETNNNSVMIYAYCRKLKEADIITYSKILERVVKILKLRAGI